MPKMTFQSRHCKTNQFKPCSNSYFQTRSLKRPGLKMLRLYFPIIKTHLRLANQMRDSARSAKQNIREGYRKGSINIRQHHITFTFLRLYDFKCAWFDETNYREFFPLHVVYKLRDRARKEDPKQLKFQELIETEPQSED